MSTFGICFEAAHMCTWDDLNCSDSTGQVVNPQSWNFDWPCSVKQNIRLYFLYGDNFPCVYAITAGLPRKTGVRQIHQQAFMPVRHSADLCLWKSESLCYIYNVLSHIFIWLLHNFSMELEEREVLGTVAEQTWRVSKQAACPLSCVL